MIFRVSAPHICHLFSTGQHQRYAEPMHRDLSQTTLVRSYRLVTTNPHDRSRGEMVKFRNVHPSDRELPIGDSFFFSIRLKQAVIFFRNPRPPSSASSPLSMTSTGKPGLYIPVDEGGAFKVREYAQIRASLSLPAPSLPKFFHSTMITCKHHPCLNKTSPLLESSLDPSGGEPT